MSSNPNQHFDLHQRVGFTSNLLESFKARFGGFRECSWLFEFITPPHERAVNKADLSYIPGAFIRDFELEVADLKASNKWVNKFKSLNEDPKYFSNSKHKWTKMTKL